MDIDPFRIRALVPDFETIEAGYTRASAAARATLPQRLDLAYGPGPDERLDLFFPAAGDRPVPVHLFVHGGYWRANRKETYAFLAAPVVAAGAIAAIADYALMPGARMAELISQVRRAAAWLAAEAPSFGGDPGQITASGHSAGAHLASYLAARGPAEGPAPAVSPRALLLVSGIYDLSPITGSFLQQEIALTPEEVAQWSPLGAEPTPGVRRVVAVGGKETAPFHAQAATFCERTGGRLEVVPGLDHMTILAEMAWPGSAVEKLLLDCVAG